MPQGRTPEGTGPPAPALLTHTHTSALGTRPSWRWFRFGSIPGGMNGVAGGQENRTGRRAGREPRASARRGSNSHRGNNAMNELGSVSAFSSQHGRSPAGLEGSARLQFSPLPSHSEVVTLWELGLISRSLLPWIRRSAPKPQRTSRPWSEES